MKKITALILCLAMCAAVFVGCSKGSDEEDKGATISAYLSSDIYHFDPAYAYTDDASASVLSLIYEGLFKYDKNGKPVKALAKSYKYNTEDNYLEIELAYSCWSDGKQVYASDFVYAFKRIVEPEFHGEAASMLYLVKNGRDVKLGEKSIDDFGVYDVGSTTLRIELEDGADYKQMLEYLASPMLVPLREDAVNKAGDWSTNVSILVCNGPFSVRSFDPAKKLVLERNQYYRRNVDKDSVKKYVTPYRISIDLSLSEEELTAAYKDGKLAFDGNLLVSARGDYKDDAKVSDSMSTLSVLFNTEKAPFDNADVRKALSLALDRQAIADKLVFAEPATGLVTGKVFDTSSASKKMFRTVGGDLISTSADTAKAKSLLSSAGVSGGSITLTVKDNDENLAAAEMIKSAWSSLGFDVTIRKLSCTTYKDENEYQLYRDNYTEAYLGADFEAILTDYVMPSTSAFSCLAGFARPFSGGSIDITAAETEFAPGVTGYASDKYDELIEKAYAEKDLAARATLLHEAEKLLLEDAPIVPVVFNQNAYVCVKGLRKLTVDYYGNVIFTKAKLSDYENYLSE